MQILKLFCRAIASIYCLSDAADEFPTTIILARGYAFGLVRQPTNWNSSRSLSLNQLQLNECMTNILKHSQSEEDLSHISDLKRKAIPYQHK